jgi:CRP-like cAMP-binding protein
MQPFPSSTLFDRLPARALARLAGYGRSVRFEPGELLIVEGQPNVWLHVITSGQVCLERDAPGSETPNVLGRLGPGDVIGAHGILDLELPATTVRAIGPVESFRLHHPAIAWTLLGVPEAIPAFEAALRVWIEAENQRQSDRGTHARFEVASAQR